MDWLEIYCHEPELIQLDASYFRRAGYKVVERPYGTRMYRTMFTIYEHDNPVYEIRRDPLSKKSDGGIFVDESCHIRLHNMELYKPQPIQRLQYFLRANGYRFQNVSRYDICLDLQKFDNQMLPSTFVELYMKGSYSKIHQSNLTAYGTEKNSNSPHSDADDVCVHGRDSWTGRIWNSLKWGSPTSAISTKLYNKSLELSRDGHDKPYIRDAWYEAGLSMDENGQPTSPVWRIEFSVRATKRYLEVKASDGSNKKTKIEIGETMEMNLDKLADRWSLLYLWMSFESTYFHFKIKKMTREGTPQRKDRCPDLALIRNSSEYDIYKPVQVKHKKAPDRTLKLLLKKLREIIAKAKEDGSDHELLNACATLIRYLKYEYNIAAIDNAALDDLYRKLSMEPRPEMRMFILSQYFEEKFPRKPKPRHI